jgi:hypothetical protein
MQSCIGNDLGVEVVIEGHFDIGFLSGLECKISRKLKSCR